MSRRAEPVTPCPWFPLEHDDYTFDEVTRCYPIDVAGVEVTRCLRCDVKEG